MNVLDRKSEIEGPEMLYTSRSLNDEQNSSKADMFLEGSPVMLKTLFNGN